MPVPKAKGAAAAEKRERSPNFPAIAFDAALENTKKLWMQAKKYPLSVELALKHMGYTNNGRSFRVLSALRKYGLVVPEGKEIRVSDDANAIFIYPEGSEERESRIKRLAMQPAIFRQVLQKFPGELPADDHLAAKLQHDMEFTASAAEELIKVLRHSMRTAGVDRGESGADSAMEVIAPEAAPMPQPIASAIASSPRAAGPIVSALPGAPQEKHAWKLGNGVWAEITITGTLRAKQLDKLKGYVALLDAEEDTEGKSEQES